MSYTIVISERAYNELSDACEWYDDRIEGLGDKFREIVFDKFAEIKKNPIRARMRRKHYYEDLIKKFPYLIIYRTSEDTKEVYISSVFHTSRNPRKKYKG